MAVCTISNHRLFLWMLSHQEAPSTQDERRSTSTHAPKQPTLAPTAFLTTQVSDTHINHCSVENFTPSTLSLNPATSCSILVSVSLIFSSCTFASSLILPFSRFKSSRTLACVRLISSRSREFSFARSLVSRSCEARVRAVSVESAERSSERSFVKSTFWV